MVTVTIHFVGGPYDGGCRRVSSSSLRRGKFIFRERRRHLYASDRAWDGAANHVLVRDVGRLVKVEGQSGA